MTAPAATDEAARAAARTLAHRMIGAFATGWFPVDVDPDDRIVWRTVEQRAVIEPTEAVLARARRSFKAHRWSFDVRPDSDFEAVLAACSGRRGNVLWLTDRLCDGYRVLHEMGIARCVAVYDTSGDLVGGALLATIGGAGFAESTFHRAYDAGNAAITGVIQLLLDEGRRLLDLQYLNSDHFRRFGAVEIPRVEYLDRLRAALEPPEPRTVHVPRRLREAAAAATGD